MADAIEQRAEAYFSGSATGIDRSALHPLLVSTARAEALREYTFGGYWSIIVIRRSSLCLSHKLRRPRLSWAVASDFLLPIMVTYKKTLFLFWYIHPKLGHPLKLRLE